MLVPDPLTLNQIAGPFNDPDRIYMRRSSIGGLRALGALLERAHCEFLSRKSNPLYGVSLAQRSPLPLGLASPI